MQTNRVTVRTRPLPNTSGCTFSGWSLNADLSGVLYAAGQQIPGLSANADLYAVWTNCTIYTVTYHDPLATPPVDPNHYKAGDRPTTLQPGPNTAGCLFAGWSLKADGSAPYYATGTEIPALSGSVDLYAVWSDCRIYTVRYDANGGDVASTVPVDGANPYAAGVTVTVLYMPAPSKAGYVFLGWSQSSNGAVAYSAGGVTTFTMPAADVTLYAVWARNTYVVRYDGNGPTSGTPPLDTQRYAPGATVTVTPTGGTLAQNGCAFVGWSLTSGAKNKAKYGVAPLSATLTMANDDVILYAVWDCDKTPTPIPTPVTPVPLTVVAGRGGSVDIASHAIGAVDNGQGEAWYPSGYKETLRAIPQPGFRAVWGGACHVTGTTCSVTMSQARLVTVMFVPDIKLPVFFFDTDRWVIHLSAKVKAKLMRDLRTLSTYGIKRLYATGYADIRSTPAHNRFLSRQRSHAAALYINKLLKQMHLRPMAFVYQPMGQTTKFGRGAVYAPNRRTSIDF